MLIFSITWTPSNHLDKILDTQPTIIISVEVRLQHVSLSFKNFKYKGVS